MAPDSFLSWRALVSGLIGALGAIVIYKAVDHLHYSGVFRKAKRKAVNFVKQPSTKLPAPGGPNKKPVRIWLDGCFDLMHFGHANAFRQAKALGDVLVVGLNPDSEVLKYKGPPILNDSERYAAVAACKWVDQVVTEVPYVLNQEYLDEVVFKKYDIDYVVHGDDPCLLPDGSDVFATAKAAGRFKTIKRTEGVSSTDVVGRMLLATRDHFTRIEDSEHDSTFQRRLSDLSEPHDTNDMEEKHNFTRVSQFLATSRRITQFSSGKQPKQTDRIVYIVGSFDMFHKAHIETLEKARACGDFLLVGVLADDQVNKMCGFNYPIMNLHERVLSVLSCRHVDEVIMGAPLELSKDMLTTMNISVVVEYDSEEFALSNLGHDIFELPRKLGLMKKIEITSDVTTMEIVQRVMNRRSDYEAKYERKSKKEEEYLEQKTYVAEL